QIGMSPLTVCRDVTRKTLAEYTRPPTHEADRTAPRPATEHELASIWADVLRVKHVGINDNFFDLGGGSILGTLILARAARAGLKSSPTQLFEYQTIAELATIASGPKLHLVDAALPPLCSEGWPPSATGGHLIYL